MNSIINNSGNNKSNNSNNDSSTKMSNTIGRSIQLQGGADDLETFVMGNCLMLQAAAAAAASAASAAVGPGDGDDVGRMYPCKTCGRKFNSFQALGGHRASHRKAKTDGGIDGGVDGGVDGGGVSAAAKVKSHACSICGVEFPIGQALGGHMRRHRPPVVVPARDGNGSTVTSEGSGENSEKKRKNDGEAVLEEEVEKVVKKVKKEEVWLELGLNFDAWAENINKNNNNNEEQEKEKEKEKEKVKEEEINGGEEIEEGEIVEEEEEEEVKEVAEEEEEEEEIEDFLRLELRTPSIRFLLGCNN